MSTGLNVEDALQMCSAPSPDFTGGEWCYAANTLAEEVQRLRQVLSAERRDRAWWASQNSRERRDLYARLAAPCAECGHIDWRELA